MKYIAYFIMLITATSLLYAPIKYNVINPDGTVDTVGLQLSVLDIYNTFQLRKFNKLNTIPAANQIGEQQLLLYRSTSTNIARIYTIIDNTTYYLSAIGMDDVTPMVSDSDKLDGYHYSYFATTITAYNLAQSTGTLRNETITSTASITAMLVSTGTTQTISGAKTFSATTNFSSATFSGNANIVTANISSSTVSDFRRTIKSKMRAYLGTDGTILPTTYNKIQFDNENYDDNNEFTVSGASSGTFVAKESGIYMVLSAIQLTGSFTANARNIAAIYKNDVAYSYGDEIDIYGTGITSLRLQLQDTVALAIGSTLDIRVSHTNATSKTVNANQTYLNIYKLSE